MSGNTIKTQFPSIQEMTGRVGRKPETVGNFTKQGLSFEQILSSRTGENVPLKFSKHASERMLSRNIDLSEEQYERLETGVTRAGEKGIRESLVMVDNFAFIVNTNNNTVITAVGDSEEKIFTNIDGAVIA